MRVADEGNPIMAMLIEIDPRLFLLVKLLAVTLACVILWVLREHRLAKVISMLSALLYVGIIYWHFIGAWNADLIELPTTDAIMNMLADIKQSLIQFFSQVIDEIGRGVN